MQNLIVGIIMPLYLGCISSAAYSINVIYPLGAPRIASDFHNDVGVNGGQRETKHQALDFTEKFGQPILAAADGTVLVATVEKCRGLTIAVDHGKGIDGKKIVALQGHSGEMSVVTGDKIKRGETIGRLGNNYHDFDCIWGVRHLQFQIGREYRRKDDKGYYWGYLYFLKDGNKSIIPHLFSSDGPGKVTCFEPDKSFRRGTLTYPVPCG